MPKHKIVVGLGFGDEGKGTIVDYLTSISEYDWVVRFSGGPQAAHNVVTADGTHHTFAQFGSGTFNGCGTILSRFMLVNPFNLVKEADALEEKGVTRPLDSMVISEQCLLVTPWHAEINRIEEIRRGDKAHGSCGQGIGVAQKFAIDYPDMAFRMGDLYLDHDSFVAKAMIVRELFDAEYGVPSKEERKEYAKRHPNDMLRRRPQNLASMYEFLMLDYDLQIVSDNVIPYLLEDSIGNVFEGSQGVLLDEWQGFHPYTTWSTTTPENALQLLSEASVDVDKDVEIIGVTRTYHTRHGAGPFPNQLKDKKGEFPELHNGTGIYQGSWRVGTLDYGFLRYATEAAGRIDSLAITHMDLPKVYVSPDDFLYDILAYGSGDLEHQEDLTNQLMELKLKKKDAIEISTQDASYYIQMMTGVPVSIHSYGPKTNQKVALRFAPI